MDLLTFFTEALFSLDMAAYSITESGGFQRVFAQIVNGVFLGTNVEVTVRTLPADPLSAVGRFLQKSSECVCDYVPFLFQFLVTMCHVQ